MDKMTKYSGYDSLVESIGTLLDTARSHVATSVNTILVQTYWNIGKYIVEYEQAGAQRAVSRNFAYKTRLAALIVQALKHHSLPNRISYTDSGASPNAHFSRTCFPLRWSMVSSMLSEPCESF